MLLPVSGANGASVSGTTVTLPAGTDLSAVVTTLGATQSAIHLADAPNANQKIFKITGKAGSGGATPDRRGRHGANWVHYPILSGPSVGGMFSPMLV